MRLRHLVALSFPVFLAGYNLRFRGENFEKLYLETQHELIEHGIRLLSIFQGGLGSLSTGRSVVQGGLVPSTGLRALVVNLFVTPLVKAWKWLMDQSYKHGYAAGVANALKFSTRLKKDAELVDTQDRVYNLLKWSTGSDLSLRNKAEADVESERYTEAVKKYEELIINAEKTGCRLNEIKGILGIANANRARKLSPLLSGAQIDRFDELAKEIEGGLWEGHFSCVRSQLVALSRNLSSI
jgi:hypothetical protein